MVVKMKKDKILVLLAMLLMVILVSYADYINKKVEINKDEKMAIVGFKEHKIDFGENRTDDNVTEYSFELKKDKGKASKNFILMPNGTNITRASELMAAIPGCDSINYWNESMQKWIGWINLRGGRGTDFDIIAGKVYEISVVNKTDLELVVDN